MQFIYANELYWIILLQLNLKQTHHETNLTAAHIMFYAFLAAKPKPAHNKARTQLPNLITPLQQNMR